ncbi:sigma-70 family RNA polymerase sigma factor [Niallia alba]|uniref:sigma-70 family RNA polymerase sigma factor n=1 Tax=Niallia alba TaxID=2729105 RepID=UPI0003328D17|nr:RNA polymerase sigma-32 subunit RpoH [Niallia nealsonii AAU1]
MLDLIKKARKGDEKAFLTLFQYYQQDIYKMAFVYVKNQNDALDVVQETAYRSFKAIKTLKEPRYFKTWLIKIAINCSLDLLRVNNKVMFSTSIHQQLVTYNDYENLDLEITLRDLIDSLSEEEKSIVILRYYEGVTFKDISKILDIPIGTAKTILYRSINKLRKEIKGDDIYE